MSDTLHCRFARAEEVPTVARLVAHSFPGPTRTQAWLEEQLREPRFGGGPETLWLGERDGAVVGAFQLHPLRQWIGGARLPMAGVGTVAISPVHRKRRLAELLVASGLRAARERGDLVSALYPFRVSFYHRLGYGNAGVVEQWQVPAATLPDAPERTHVELLEDEAARGEALALYGDWARAQNGQLDRTPRMWSYVLSQAERALVGYRAADGTLAGYAVVAYRTDLKRRDRFLEVEELVWTTQPARRGLLAWLGSLGDQWEQVLLRTLPAHRLQDWLREPRLPPDAAPGWQLWSPAATLLMGPMFRLLDVAGAWERRSITGMAGISTALEITDAHLPENAGRWLLTLEGGRAALVRDGSARSVIRLDIATLSRIYIGALSPAAAFAAGLLACDRPDLLPALDAALALPEPWLFDRF